MPRTTHLKAEFFGAQLEYRKDEVLGSEWSPEEDKWVSMVEGKKENVPV